MDSRTRTRRVIVLVMTFVIAAFALDFLDINSVTATALLLTTFLICLYQLLRKPRPRR